MTTLTTMGITDFLGRIIAGRVEDESLAQAICCFMRDHVDSESTAMFADWAIDYTPEVAAAKMTLPGCDEVRVADYISADDMSAFADYAEEYFGIVIYPSDN